MATERLIDANALFAKFERIAKKSGVPHFHLDEIADEINEADAVEVVRCKDCRKCLIYDDVITRQKQYECRLWHGATREVSADSFCDAGERREGE